MSRGTGPWAPSWSAPGVSSLDVLGCLKALQQMGSEYLEYRRVAEQEATRREEIRARTQVTLERIRAQREVIQDYLQRSFDERRENFARLFGAVDRAMEGGNVDQLAHTLAAITELAKSSPFKALADANAVSQAFADPDHEWDV